MTDNPEALARTALSLIDRAFANRSPPSVMANSMQLSDLEHDEVMAFEHVCWQEIRFDQVEKNADAVFWFSPQAFCYYLPGLLAAGLKENRWDTNAYDALIGMLDRSPEPDYWDDFFLLRWPRLSVAEIEAIQSWVRWLESVQPDAFHTNTFERVEKTLALLQAVRRPD